MDKCPICGAVFPLDSVDMCWGSAKHMLHEPCDVVTVCPDCENPATMMPENRNYGPDTIVFRCTSGECLSGWEVALSTACGAYRYSVAGRRSDVGPWDAEDRCRAPKVRGSTLCAAHRDAIISPLEEPPGFGHAEMGRP